MINYVVILIQLMIWSIYTLLEWLSKHDQLIYNVAMFLIFVYLAMVTGNLILKSAKKTVWITFISLIVYSVIQILLNLF
ncbi:hypothetical protein [Robertmurraya massiliosenegalensis]|uniref:hypothetical protein n=1 Tax=Robertmurraya massiliosenegalensis TaxID=1287657 RepID=UPI0002E78E94|nr:hypothetical protein [Robertmurraya massiliosenegalensis]